MRVAMLTTDGREILRSYEGREPMFGTAPEALLKGMAELTDLELHVISCLQRPVSSPERLAPNIWFHTLHVPKLGWLRTGYQGCIRTVRKCLHGIQPDIVHGQGTERDCAISAVLSGFPNVLTIHGNMRLISKVNKAKPFSFLWLHAQLEKVTLPRTDGIICITDYTRQAVAKLARRTWVLPNAVDPSFFNIHPSPDFPRTILCIGNISLRKNQNAFIRSLDSLASKTKFKLLFLGASVRENPYDSEFFSLLSTRPWCAYEGLADREKLKSYLERATFVALPSLEDNCPMVVLEAMAAGVPVLASNVGGVPELIEDGVTGLFCNPDEPASFLRGVEKILNDADFAARLAVAAKKEALTRFHPAVIAKRHVEIYREVLNR